MVSSNSDMHSCFLDSPAKQVIYRYDPATNTWINTGPIGKYLINMSVDRFHLVHEMYEFPYNSVDPQEMILTSYEGVHKVNLLTKNIQELIPSTLRPKIEKCGWISAFFGEVIPTNYINEALENQFYATIESLHGDKLVIYYKSDNQWTRKIIDQRTFISTGNHSVYDQVQLVQFKFRVATT